MKAIHVHEFGGPEVMKFEEAEDLTGGPGQILVEVRAAGVLRGVCHLVWRPCT